MAAPPGGGSRWPQVAELPGGGRQVAATPGGGRQAVAAGGRTSKRRSAGGGCRWPHLGRWPQVAAPPGGGRQVVAIAGSRRWRNLRAAVGSWSHLRAAVGRWPQVAAPLGGGRHVAAGGRQLPSRQKKCTLYQHTSLHQNKNSFR